ncbi:MAG: hypothetical protein ACYDB1_05370 [Acidiferrobacteraceae bacterium]
MQPPLDSFVAVPLSHDLYAQLAQRYPAGVSSVLEHVIQDFLDRAEEDFTARREEARQKGLQWDALFLPHGTQIRTKYFGKYTIAEIVAGEIRWDGQVCPSMSRLARAMRGDTSNNAWVVLEIKRPTDADWIRADRLRK